MSDRFDYFKLGLDREYLAYRCDALWEHSPEARDAVARALDDVGLRDPLTADPAQQLALAVRLYDLDGAYPEAGRDALVDTARLAGQKVAEVGGRSDDARRLAQRWFSAELRPIIEDSFLAASSSTSSPRGARR